jgi:Diadenosine tetraphosphate (Ap4A) hydrolase and other HIT family hydrolases
MNLYPYNNAHLLITPYNHVDTTDQLDIDTLNEIIWFANESMIIMKKNLNTDWI